MDRDRLVRLFSGPDLEPLLMRMRRRLERGQPLSGTIVLTNLSSAQREAVAALLGRLPTQTGDQFVSVPLDDLAERLREAGVCDSLPAAVEVLTGPVPNTVAAREERQAAWDDVFRGAPEVLRRPPLAAWLDDLRATGTLKRLARSAPAAAQSLLGQLAYVAGAWPAGGEPLASFAAAVAGNAHALDPGSPLATLALQMASRLTGTPLEDNTEGRRTVWASVGVLCDELSTPALVLNLPASGDSTLGRLLRAASAAGEPLHLSLRLLLRCPLTGDAGFAGRDVFICENPTIVALAAARLGMRCAPLVCVNGTPATPVIVLLRQLRAAGATLRYHGDFDAGGLAIARRLIAAVGAVPWRFGAEDYAAAPKGTELHGALGETPWSPTLRGAMQQIGRVVHEEAVFATLAADLARSARPSHP